MYELTKELTAANKKRNFPALRSRETLQVAVDHGQVGETAAHIEYEVLQRWKCEDGRHEGGPVEIANQAGPAFAVRRDVEAAYCRAGKPHAENISKQASSAVVRVARAPSKLLGTLGYSVSHGRLVHADRTVADQSPLSSGRPVSTCVGLARY